MAGWNHRVVKHRYDNGISEVQESYHVHEVYYDDEGNATSITADPVAPMGDTVDELRDELEMFMAATHTPVLNYDDF